MKRVCSVCTEELDKSNFSKKQWSKPDAARRCKNCGKKSNLAKSEIAEYALKHQLPAGKLEGEMAKAARAVVAAYEDFWSNIKFRKGWARPVFTQDEVAPLLEQAADIVVRIRAALDASGTEFKLRMVDGSAREFMWQVNNEEEDPLKDPHHFVTGLVHATFRDANGYVEGLTKEAIDEVLRHVDMESLGDEERARAERIVASIEEALGRLNAAAQGALARVGPRTRQDVRNLAALASALADGQAAATAYAAAAFAETAGAPPRSPKDVPMSPADIRPMPNEHVRCHCGREIAAADYEGHLARCPVLSPKGGARPSVQIPDDAPGSTHSTPREGTPRNTASEETPAAPEAVPAEESPGAGAASDDDSPSEDGALLEIENITVDVDNTRKSIQSLHDQTDNLTPSSAAFKVLRQASHPDASLKMLKGHVNEVKAHTEHLMQDLEALDQVGIGKEAVRPVRKQAVKEIMALLEDLDSLGARLRASLKAVEQEKEKIDQEKAAKEEMERQAAAAKAAEEAKAAAAARQQAAAKAADEARAAAVARQQAERADAEKKKAERAAAAAAEAERAVERAAEAEADTDARVQGLTVADLSPLWRQLKLEPEFSTSRGRDGTTVVSSHIPGMKVEDIKLAANPRSNTLTVSGFRGPTQEQESLMARQIEQMLARRGVEYRSLDPVQRRELLLRMGAGRFGSFSVTLQLPEGVAPDDIRASYEGGNVALVVPPSRVTAPQARYPSRAGYGAGLGGAPTYESDPWGALFGGGGGGGRGGFMGDRDVWW